MRVKNLTPFLFAARVTCRTPPQAEAVLIVRARYLLGPDGALRLPVGPLAQGQLTAETFRDGDDERAGECVYPGDFADWKPRADVLLRGTCFPPGGAAARECPVRFAVGGWSKTLRAVGPRVWVDSLLGAVPTEPAPFTRMPLGYDHAFGGPGYARNPAGKGIGTAELPCVERPGEPVRSRHDPLEPAGFGPISPSWPQRRDKLGEAYGAAYREARGARYAADLDWTYFNAAPADQQLDALHGDEELVLTNLRPEAPIVAARLPGLRVRAFVRGARGEISEVAMRLDTLFVDADEGTVTLTWRGLHPAADPDLRDLSAALVASEPLGEAPAGDARYRDALDALERDPLGLEAAVPPHLAEPFRAMREGRPIGAPEPDGGDPISALLARRLGPIARDQQEQVRRALERLLATGATGGADLRALVGGAANAAPAPGPAPLPRGPAAKPRVDVASALRGVLERAEALRRKAEAQGAAAPWMERLEALARDPRLRALDPALRAPGEPAPPPAEPGPGRDLSGQDLRGRDLRGADLTGADLSDAILAGADLRGAKLAGATLRRAVLTGADLTGADLTGADLTLAHLGKVRAGGAALRETTWTQAYAAGAALAGADLTGARGREAQLAGADLTGARAAGLDFEDAALDGATLDRIDLTGARLEACRLAGASAREARLSGAILARASFAGADLTGAALDGARGGGLVAIGATLEGADLRYAALPDAHLSDARLARARARGADLRRARLYRAALDDADLTGANLLGADLRRASLARAVLARANLYDAKILDAVGPGVDLSGAFLARSTLERP